MDIKKFEGSSSRPTTSSSDTTTMSALGKFLEKKGFGKRMRKRSSSLPPENRLKTLFKEGSAVIASRHIFRNNSSGHVNNVDRKPTRVYKKPDKISRQGTVDISIIVYVHAIRNIFSCGC